MRGYSDSLSAVLCEYHFKLARWLSLEVLHYTFYGHFVLFGGIDTGFPASIVVHAFSGTQTQNLSQIALLIRYYTPLASTTLSYVT